MIPTSGFCFYAGNHNDWTGTAGVHLVSAAETSPLSKRRSSTAKSSFYNRTETTDFQSLQNAFRDQRIDVVKYYVFDLLYLEGEDLLQRPLIERKSILKDLLDRVETNDTIRYSDHIEGNGEDFKKHACRLHLEGMISKRRDQPYRPGRGSDWLKVKCIHYEEFVIGGFTDPSGSRTGFGALLVGFFGANDELHYAGKVGTGFDARTLKEMHSRLKGLEQETSPFVDLKRKVGDARKAHWVRPDLVGQFKFGSQTRDKKLRHASFQGLREDKPADEVKMETSVPIEEIPKASGSPKTKPRSSSKARDHVDKKPAANSHRRRSTAEKSDQRAAEYDAASGMIAGSRLHPS